MKFLAKVYMQITEIHEQEFEADSAEQAEEMADAARENGVGPDTGWSATRHSGDVVSEEMTIEELE